MQQTRRTLLKAGIAATVAGLAGCAGSSDEQSDNETTGTESTATPGETQPSDGDESDQTTASLSAETAVAARWNVLRARLYDAVALGRAGETEAGARAAGSLFEDFEGMEGEYGAHEMLEETDEEAYGAFEGGLSDLESALGDGDVDGAIEAAATADSALRDAQASLTTGRVAQALTLQALGARAATAEVLAGAETPRTAADVATATLSAFEEAPVHETVEEAGAEAYEAFEGALSDLESRGNGGDAEAVTSAGRKALSAAIEGSYAVVGTDGIAGVGHLAAMGARGHDAATLAALGGPSTEFAHAAGLTLYRARAYDGHWMAEQGASDTAETMARDVFAHFEGARAHEALEEADHEAYEGFESGLDALATAIADGNDNGVDSAVETVDSNLVAGVEALATETEAALLEAGFFRARLADARTLYDRGQTDTASDVVQSVFQRFEADELGFHETLEDTDEDLYETFEDEHLTALVDAMADGDDSAVDTHYRGAQQALLDFEARHSATLAGPPEAVYVTGRAFDAAGLAALGDASAAETVVGDAFEHFEAGAGGFHEALEEADHETYETFESRLGAVRTAAGENGDVYAATTECNESGVEAAYTVVDAAGGASAGAAADTMGDVFATFENADVHEQLEEGDHEAYEGFEDALSSFQSALSEGGDVSGAAAAFDRATTRALFAAAGAVEDAPVDAGGREESEEVEYSGGPNVVEGVPEDADHVVEMQAVAFEPASLTVSVGDTVAWEHAAGEAHNVVAYEDSFPEEAGYWASGGFDSEQAARDGWEDGEGAVQSGQAYVHTFETAGTHEYFCVPHEAAGMKGEIVVKE